MTCGFHAEDTRGITDVFEDKVHKRICQHPANTQNPAKQREQSQVTRSQVPQEW